MIPDDNFGIERDLVDFDIVGRWMDGRGLPPGTIDDVVRIGGGTQNVLLRLRRAGREYVLRRPPLHLRAKSNEVLRREARLLTALGDTDVPAPRMVAACTDDTVLGAVFYLMESVTGFNPAAELPPLYRDDPDARHAMGLSAVEGIGRLGAVDHVALGLADYGRPDGFLERQVPRWLAELDSYRSNDGYPGPRIPQLEMVAHWLQQRCPTRWEPGIMHGDCHLANTLFAYDRPELVALVDWEMSTIGDPLLDLGWQIATRPAPDSPGRTVVGALAEAGGLPTGKEMVEHYSRFSDRDLSAIDWYTVLACFKLGIVVEGTYARSIAGKASGEVGEALHTLAVDLFAQAKALIG